MTRKIDPESAALAELAAAILNEHEDLRNRRVDVELRAMEDGSVEVWADGQRRGIIPPTTLAAGIAAYVARDAKLN